MGPSSNAPILAPAMIVKSVTGNGKSLFRSNTFLVVKRRMRVLTRMSLTMRVRASFAGDVLTSTLSRTSRPSAWLLCSVCPR